MDPKRFQELVDEAVDSLPKEFADRLDNVEVVAVRRPSPRTLREMGIRRPDTLLGLYRGVPQTRRDHAYSAVAPDRIDIYREPILALVRQEIRPGEDFEEAVREQVRRTVLHEIGHHFGLAEDDLRRLDYQ